MVTCRNRSEAESNADRHVRMGEFRGHAGGVLVMFMQLRVVPVQHLALEQLLERLTSPYPLLSETERVPRPMNLRGCLP